MKTKGVTELGKFLRELRADLGITMGDFAKKIGVSSDFLSEIELGRKNIPRNLVEKIKLVFDFSAEKGTEFTVITAEHNGIYIFTTPNSRNKVELLVMLSSSIENLTDEEVEIFKNLLNK